ncbi:MAG: DUF3352 domain-containing protein [Parcubacteria group bacterium]|nr:DUF3352 domain-containing protein [Parcubacteria group bacterium]
MSRKKKVKVTVGHDHKKNSQEDLSKSGPQVNDIRNRSSRWRSLPAKNIVKIKEEKPRKKSAAYNFYKGLFFVIIGVLGLVMVGSFLYWQFFAVYSTAASLMPTNTLLYGRVNMSGLLFPDEQKDKALADLAEQADSLIDKGTGLINERTEPLGVKFVTDIKPFLGEDLHFGYFSVDSGSAEDGSKIETADWVFVVDLFDKQAVENVLQRMSYKAEIVREDYQGVEIVSIYDQEKKLLTHGLFLEDYLVISYSRVHLETIIKIHQQELTSLVQSANLKNFNPLALRNKFLYLYLQPEQLTKYVPADDDMYTLWSVAMADLQSASVTMEAKEGGLLFDMTAQKSTGGSSKRISQELIDHLPTDISGFTAGSDFGNDFSEFKQDLASKNPTAEFHLNNFQRNIEEKAQVDLDNDLFKYLNDEYLIAFNPSDGGTSYSFVFKLKDEEQVKTQLAVLEEAVANYFGSVYPLKKEITLSDGSKAQELFSDQESFQFTDLDFSGMKIRSVANPDLSNSFSYIILEDKLLVSTSLESLKNLLVAYDSQTSGRLLSNKRYFNLPYSEVTSWRSENMFYADLNDLASYLQFSKAQQKYFESFDTVLFSSFSQDKKIFWQGFLYIEEDNN